MKYSGPIPRNCHSPIILKTWLTGLNYPEVHARVFYEYHPMCGNWLLAPDSGGMSVFVLGKWAVGRQQRSKCGNQGETDRVEGLGRAGGGNEEEQRWSRGKSEPTKHFPVHFSSGRLN